MCGITAIFAYRDSAPAVDRDEVEAITQRMFPRGPDAGGTWFSTDGRVGLGSRRLAIIDLSPDGNQPMLDSSGQLAIVFNGEIYNYRELRARLQRKGVRFRTTSDTEVLLELYRSDGDRMVELLRGMFAFAIWDLRTRRMFVARDAYGIKPFYVADDGHTIRMASTVKALQAGGRISRAHDPGGVAGFWILGSVPEPHTVFRDIRSVEAGTSFFIDASGVHPPRRYYSIAATFARAAEEESAARLVEARILMRECVTESLEHHLIADVAVGAFLSSGIDSSALVSLATELRGVAPNTITLQFAEFRGRQTDESPLASRFAAELGSDHATRLVSREEFIAEVPLLLDAMDQPTINGTNTYFVSKAARERGLKVALSGLGGDELFGSYPSFRALPRIVAASHFPLAAAALGRIVRNPKGEALARYGRTYPGAYLLKRALFLPDDLPDIMGPQAAEEGLQKLSLLEHIAAAMSPDPRTTFGRIATLEASLYMRNQLLRDTDWASMAHSVEVRTPLVDAALLGHIAPLLLVERRRCKQHFAESPRRPLPDYLKHRSKTGFAVPLAEWMQLPADGTSMRMRSWARRVWEHWA
ncbi:MAG: asparagine synthase (glutamine-hydrolyzing) [Acidobacteriota bacterium]